jgi:hypothetical protein
MHFKFQIEIQNPTCLGKIPRCGIFTIGILGIKSVPSTLLGISPAGSNARNTAQLSTDVVCAPTPLKATAVEINVPSVRKFRISN